MISNSDDNNILVKNKSKIVIKVLNKSLKIPEDYLKVIRNILQHDHYLIILHCSLFRIIENIIVTKYSDLSVYIKTDTRIKIQ